MKSLTHETFNNENEAKEIFYEIIKHLNFLNSKLERDVGIVVATIDYLKNITGDLEEPKIIEEDKSEILVESSTKDELTNLYLRDIFDISIKKAVAKASRIKTPLSLAMIDIDDFKKVNDNYGHQEGDKVLSKIGNLINDSIREMDLAARYGGEELAILMIDISLDDAVVIAERIRKKIANLNFNNFSVTVSIGVSQLDKHINSEYKLVETSDYALYQAKHLGKNRVERYKHYD